MDSYGSFRAERGASEDSWTDDTPVYVFSATHPLDMVEYAGQGFDVDGIFFSNSTPQLEQIARQYPGTEVYAPISEGGESKVPQHVPMSHHELGQLLNGTGPEELVRLVGEDTVERFYSDARREVEETVEACGEAYIFPYKVTPGLEQFAADIDGATVIGPDSSTVEYWSHKPNIYRLAQDNGVSVVDGTVAEGVDDARDILHSRNWNQAFVSAENGAGGRGSIRAESPADVTEVFDDYDGELIVTRWLGQDDLVAAPSVSLFVGRSPGETAVLSVSDQHIVNDTVYRGNSSPLDPPGIDSQELQEQIRDESHNLADHLRDDGFLGSVGIDGVVNTDGDFSLVEVNARKTCPTSLYISLLEQERERAPSIAELEAALYTGQGGDIAEWIGDVEMPGQEWVLRYVKTPRDQYLDTGSLPTGLDHRWDGENAYVTNIPHGGRYVPPGDEEFGESSVELGRVVAPNETEAQEKIQEIEAAFGVSGPLHTGR